MNYIDKSIYDNVELMSADITGWHSDSIVFHNLIDEIKPKTIIEVGTWKGASAIHMANHIKYRGYDTKIICVDTWLGALEFWDRLKDTSERNLLLKNGYPQIYYQFLSNVLHSQTQDIILPFPNTSNIAYYYFNNKQIKSEMIYIDASHEEEDVYQDVSNYYNLLETNGIIFGDDYDWQGVRQAINRFSNEKNVKVDILENIYWTIKK